MRWLLLTVLFACHKAPADPSAPAAVIPPETPGSLPAPAPAPAPDEAGSDLPPPSLEVLQTAARALSTKDQAPDCAAIEAELGADPIATWTYIVNTVTMPPQVPMRAAGCLIALHAEASTDTFVGWMRSESTVGLARLLIAQLDALPEAVAVTVVKAGLSGPIADDVRAAAAESGSEAVRAAAQ